MLQTEAASFAMTYGPTRNLIPGSAMMHPAGSAGMVTATGRLRREDWGITGGQLIGGSNSRIGVVFTTQFAVRTV
jgi:hypothetical protein